MGVFACTRTRTLPPLDHTPIHQRRCPAPSPGRHCGYWCLSHAMRGARCVLYGAPRGKGRGRTVTGVKINCKHARRGPRSTAPPAPPALATVTRTLTLTHQALNYTRGVQEGAQRGSWGPGTMCLSAPFAKLRPPAESPQTALSSPHCLMLPRRAFTLSWLSQKRLNYLYKMPLAYGLNRPHSTSQKICFWQVAWTGHAVQNTCLRQRRPDGCLCLHPCWRTMKERSSAVVQHGAAPASSSCPNPCMLPHGPQPSPAPWRACIHGQATSPAQVTHTQAGQVTPPTLWACQWRARSQRLAPRRAGAAAQGARRIWSCAPPARADRHMARNAVWRGWQQYGLLESFCNGPVTPRGAEASPPPSSVRLYHCVSDQPCWAGLSALRLSRCTAVGGTPAALVVPVKCTPRSTFDFNFIEQLQEQPEAPQSS